MLNTGFISRLFVILISAVRITKLTRNRTCLIFDFKKTVTRYLTVRQNFITVDDIHRLLLLICISIFAKCPGMNFYFVPAINIIK